ncbi:hypothetical protein TVNIR_2144 [Thioalkalivibrio nitratireducens DSM 14787]|uniref:Phage tail protein n=1 Tax=Thioalkalivibrio nitratireducens (strain DSM 14787 / UNIQEM 213 / ALEN2) TaxID=1255043 RepID=L0DXV2_THIND|nr:phage tail protein [Thioalkalivibrio nitratireducens]AGA33800.1 hypothetical protein TVNIR_2144 [Thioalkalivibrio nitratireducens DSM 14787]
MTEFVPFRFRVSLYNGDRSELLCGGQFSEVTGLEVTMEPKLIAEGGRNWGAFQRAGQTRFAPVVLKRGVTSIDDLWKWFDITTRGANYGYRLEGEIEVLGHPSVTVDGTGDVTSVQDHPVLVWKLAQVLATRFKGPDLSATASQAAIEELHLVHEGLTLVRPAAGEGA